MDNSQKSTKWLILIIVLFSLFSSGLAIAYYFGRQSVKEAIVLPTPTIVTITPTLPPEAIIPSPVNSLFKAINKKLGEEFKESQVNMPYFFYKGSYSTQKVWQIDLSQVYKDKTKINEIYEIISRQYEMKDSGGGGEGGNSFVETYANSNLECTIDSHNAIVKLSCLDK